MTKAKAKALVQTDPLPDEWEGKRKAYESVYCITETTRAEACKKLKSAKEKRCPEKGYFCPGGKHEGVHYECGRWYAYLHFARYK